MNLDEAFAELKEETDWVAEAEAVIQDVHSHVTSISLSAVKPSTSGILLNIRTIEEQDFCVLLGPAGFLVVGNTADDKSLENVDDQQFFETLYALLSSVSPSYVQSFGNLLIKKLNDLSNKDNDL